MSSTTDTSFSPKIFESTSYISMKEFHQLMAKKAVSPYKRKFSFQPFLKKIKAKSNGSAFNVISQDKAFYEEVESTVMSYIQNNPGKLGDESLESYFNQVFPLLFSEGQLGMISVPCTKEFIFLSPAMKEYWKSGDWELKIPELVSKADSAKGIMDMAGMILKKYYQREFEPFFHEKMTLRNKKTGLKKHFKINVVLDHVEVKVKKPVKKIVDQQIDDLFDNWEDLNNWLELFPPENFEFEGLVLIYLTDITGSEVLSELKEKVVEETEGADPKQALEQIEDAVKTYLVNPSIKMGALQLFDFEIQQHLTWSLSGKGFKLEHLTLKDFKESIYKSTIIENSPVIVKDLNKLEAKTKVEQELIKKGLRSFLLAPLFNPGGKLIGVFELASNLPNQFSKLTIHKLEEVLSLFSIGMNQWIQFSENRLNNFIQHQFTSIHPSVEWKFREVARKFLWSETYNSGSNRLERIVFKNVYPLYGQTDIVGSSTLRNHSIEADLIDNLTKLTTLISQCRKVLNFPLLDIYLHKTSQKLHGLEDRGYISSDESEIVELLTQQVHPLLRELMERFKVLPQKELKDYFEYLDPNLDIVYRKRKEYEDSVSLLNQQIASYIEEEEQKMQEILPHFFEKYTTDGVEYNIYLGASILGNGRFSEYFLKDFRLWQILKMCNITRLVKETGAKLPVSLTTAQLIFVYNNSLSIQFQMDEKQFDVDGAYNVRYEILKKRIDKARIKGTEERLTQSGKIAIVWLQEKDRLEYLEYLQHLISIGEINDEIEELELEKLQGAEGLKAFRVTVS